MQELETTIRKMFFERNKNYAPSAQYPVLTGFRKFDERTGGFENGQLILLASQPAMGSESLAIDIARNVAGTQHKKVHYFTFDQTVEDVFLDFLQIDLPELIGDTFEDLKQRTLGFKDLFFYQHLINPNIIDLIELITKIKETGLIIIDNLQLIKGMEGYYSSEGEVPFDREMQISSMNRSTSKKENSIIFRALKSMAMALNCPILILSYLPPYEIREQGLKPIPNDLTFLGDFEKLVDLSIMLWRPEYYGIYEYDNGTNTKGLAELIVYFNKEGITRDYRLHYDKNLKTFKNLD